MMLIDMMVIWVFLGVHLMWGGVDFSFTFYSIAVKDKIRTILSFKILLF